jgi:hypothetical protein
MSERVADPAVVRFPSNVATRYPDEARDLARQLWGFKLSRNAEAVAREMQTDYPGIEGRTIRRWADDGRWAETITQQVRALAPAIHEGILIDLMVGAAEGAGYLRAAARGEERAVQARVTAAIALLDRYGLSPRTDPFHLPALPDGETIDMSPDAARERMLARRRDEF